jgi:hypothetical protein
MGYRSTLITEHHPDKLPSWFEEKYSKDILVIDGTLIASKRGFKIYDNAIFEDLQKALIECGFYERSKNNSLNVAVLHEDCEVSKVIIWRDNIFYALMHDAIELDSVWQE